ncbi:MAG: HlyD family efflux transporter periplasmic adaptor subunit [Candidatus Krumholzibacteriota bacterium]
MRRPLPLLRPLSLLGTVFLLTVVAVFVFLRIDRVVVAPGCFTGGTLAVRAPLDGRVVTAAVKPGQQVAPGQLLVEFDSEPLEAEIGLAQTRIRDLERHKIDLAAEMERLTTGIHPAEAEQARREVERSKLALEDARTARERARQLAEEGLVAEEKLQEADLALRLAEIELAGRTDAVPLLERRQTEVIATLRRDAAAVDAELAEEQLTLRESQRRRTLCSVLAPDSGVVVGTGLYELEQRYLEEGEDLLRIERGVSARFEGWLDDHGRALARGGQEVKIRLDGYPWLLHGTVPGKVEFVSGRRDGNGEGAAGFPVVVAYVAGSGPGPLLDGMTGRARIVVGERVSLGRLLLERVMGVDDP